MFNFVDFCLNDQFFKVLYSFCKLSRFSICPIMSKLVIIVHFFFCPFCPLCQICPFNPICPFLSIFVYFFQIVHFVQILLFVHFLNILSIFFINDLLLTKIVNFLTFWIFMTKMTKTFISLKSIEHFECMFQNSGCKQRKKNCNLKK